MNGPGAIAAILKRVDGVLIPAVEDLTVEELRAQPAGPNTNPIGWIVWHLTRIQDDAVSRIQGVPSEWESGGWRERFAISNDPLHIDPRDVSSFDPANAETLLGYYQAVRRRTEAALAGMDGDHLDKVLPETAGRRSMTVMESFAMVVSDNTQHIGQVAYLRGLLRGQGWYANRRALT